MVKINFLTIPAQARTKKIFAIFDPNTFPRESSGASFMTASIETKSSESEVPKPIITIPIISSERPNFLPKEIEQEIKTSAPLITKKEPKKVLSVYK